MFLEKEYPAGGFQPNSELVQINVDKKRFQVPMTGLSFVLLLAFPEILKHELPI